MADPQATPLLDQQSESAPVAAPPGRRPAAHTRGWIVVGLLLTLLLLAILPPFLSLSRYQRRVTQSMSQILGRPVHVDRITLNLLPFPSFTLQNLVIDELPPFGSEPLLRASTVDARLRLLPLWSRRVEFSRISFQDPSVNLVRLPGTGLAAGRWNLETVLLQASHIDAAPTAQSRPGPAPRFPYIEATNARVNLKLGDTKTPFSATEADFALWLPEPSVWRMRLRAHPARTDTDASDTGSVQLEATLRRAPATPAVPLDLTLSWTGAPLGEASRVLTGADTGLRGNLVFHADLHGTLSSAALSTHLQVENLHRADFVPEHSIDLNLTCSGELLSVFQAAQNLHCTWPLPGTDNSSIQLAGSLPDLARPSSARLQLRADRIPAALLLDWLRVGSDRISPTLHATGELSATAALNSPLPPLPATAAGPADSQRDTPSASPSAPAANTPDGAPAQTTPLTGVPAPQGVISTGVPAPPGVIPTGVPVPQGVISTGVPVSQGVISTGATRSGETCFSSNRRGPSATSSTPFIAELCIPSLTLSGGRLSPTPITTGPLSLLATAAALPLLSNDPTALHLTLAPATVDLGPDSSATLQGTADAAGLSARLAGTLVPDRLLALGTVLPPLGDGLPDALLPSPGHTAPSTATRLDLTLHRAWGSPQTWSATGNTAPAALPSSPRPAHRR